VFGAAPPHLAPPSRRQPPGDRQTGARAARWVHLFALTR
jgi:hypothetical protein